MNPENQSHQIEILIRQAPPSPISRKPFFTLPARYRVEKLRYKLQLVDGGVASLSSNVFERPPLGLGDQEGRQHAAEHEQCKDLHHAVKPG